MWDYLLRETGNITLSIVRLILHSLIDEDIFSEVNQLGRQTYQLPTPGVEVENTQTFHCTPLLSPWLEIK